MLEVCESSSCTLSIEAMPQKCSLPDEENDVSDVGHPKQQRTEVAPGKCLLVHYLATCLTTFELKEMPQSDGLHALEKVLEVKSHR